MTSNDVLRRLRYIFDWNDDKVMALFALGDYTASRAEISDWLKKDDDPSFKKCTDEKMARFLNGVIIDLRGKKEGSEPLVETRLTNNIVLRKLKIALNLKAEDIIELLQLSNFRLGKSELSSFFRKPDHRLYVECQDQILRNFLKGLQAKYRP